MGINAFGGVQDHQSDGLMDVTHIIQNAATIIGRICRDIKGLHNVN
ncbi:MAG: hypothetical protein ACKVQS_01525 [Fimbriimonadaceae bacterium]